MAKVIINTRDIQPDDAGLFHCPECNHTAPDRRGLGVHRKFTHNVASAAATRQKKDKRPYVRKSKTQDKAVLVIPEKQVKPVSPNEGFIGYFQCPCCGEQLGEEIAALQVVRRRKQR